MSLYLNGTKAYPSPLKNLFWNSTQCSLRVCRKHSRPSMHISTKKVTDQKQGHRARPKTMVSQKFPVCNAGTKISLKNTSAS